MSFQVDIFVLDGENLQMQTHLVPKLMLQNLAIILRHFNYGKNSFIVLVPGLELLSSASLKSEKRRSVDK